MNQLKSARLINNLSQNLKYHRLLVISILGGISLFFDLFELAWTPPEAAGTLFFVDLIFHALLIPLVLGILLVWVEKSERDRQFKDRLLTLEKALMYQVGKTNSWNELVEVVIQFPRTIFPYAGAFLWLFEPEYNQFRLEAGWSFTGKRLPLPTDRPTDLSAYSKTNHPAKPENGLDLHMHSIPLEISGQPVGIIYCYYPPDQKINPHQQALVKGIAPLLSQSLHEARIKDNSAIQARLVQEERSRIAKNLHDTIAQDLFFLRLRLDQFTDGNFRDLAKLITAQEELVKLRNIADKAYSETRSLLGSLEPDPLHNLVETLSEYIGLIGERTGMVIKYVPQGSNLVIPLAVYNQVFSIFREILANIEAHAGADQVTVDLNWTNELASLFVTDNGQGFDPRRAQTEGHYGLEIMQDRARQIHGAVTVSSLPGSGTQVKLLFPIPALPEAGPPESFHWIENFGGQKKTYENTHR